MQIENQMYMATDWASMHREKMRGSVRVAEGAQTEEQSEDISFGRLMERAKSSKLDNLGKEGRTAPYSRREKDGYITYNGISFYCDYEKNRICLGDVSNMKDCICVGLSEGGSLVVNRDNLGDLAEAIGMFSPEDANRIMRAIAQDTMCQQKLMEIEKTGDSIGEAESAVDGQTESGEQKDEEESSCL